MLQSAREATGRLLLLLLLLLLLVVVVVGVVVVGVVVVTSSHCGRSTIEVPPKFKAKN